MMKGLMNKHIYCNKKLTCDNSLTYKHKEAKAYGSVQEDRIFTGKGSGMKTLSLNSIY